ncbi:unnamed protein product [Ceratitis capitata]|uniref:(Mediterranean fruit fly) hypothetical protein n=1 Tax=Ceratitis capitata TaxID=7213 RepID=A0A811U3K8_CERCA|nr:unnamed protein product [Ceratitis capitata]
MQEVQINSDNKEAAEMPTTADVQAVRPKGVEQGKNKTRNASCRLTFLLGQSTFCGILSGCKACDLPVSPTPISGCYSVLHRQRDGTYWDATATGTITSTTMTTTAYTNASPSRRHPSTPSSTSLGKIIAEASSSSNAVAFQLHAHRSIARFRTNDVRFRRRMLFAASNSVGVNVWPAYASLARGAIPTLDISTPGRLQSRMPIHSYVSSNINNNKAFDNAETHETILEKMKTMYFE